MGNRIQAGGVKLKKYLSVRMAFGVGILFILFSIMMSCIFYFIYDNQMMNHYKGSITRDVSNISMSISERVVFFDNDNLSSILIDNIFADIDFAIFERIVEAEIFVIDNDNNIISYNDDSLSYVSEAKIKKYLPKIVSSTYNDENICERITNISEDYFLAGSPIKNKDEEVIGAVILYEPVDDFKNGFNKILIIFFISLFLSFSLVIGIAIYFSIYFVKPIKKMEDISIKMAEGNYNIETGIHSEDEIGVLAKSIEVLAERLEEARLESERLDLNKKEFLSKISHELKTPVTIIRGSLESLNDDMLNDKEIVGRYVSQIKGEIIWLQKMIEELLDLTRLQASEFKLEFDEFDLGELVGDVLMSARILAKGKNIVINCKPPEKEIIINGDYDRLRQLLMILIDNAIKYSEEEKNITVIIEEDTQSVIIMDEGPGIDEDNLSHIFEPYYRNVSDRSIEGTGLGLTIAAEIIRRHGFSLNVQSKVNRGSVFKVTFNHL